MHAEVISIGDELTSGQRLDTNSQWISRRLGELGIAALYHTTVGDDLAANVAALRIAAGRCDVVIASGGLGPTADDLTRDALAAAFGRPLVLDPAVLAHIENLFARRGRPMPERNRLQSMFPAGSRPISNPHGTAPGIALELDRQGEKPCRVIALPGVPAELFEMWDQSVAPALAAAVGQSRIIRHLEIKCFGVGESELESMLPDLIRRGREPSVGITVHDATITLRITAGGSSAEACEAAMAPTVAIIRDALGDLVFGEGDDELSDAVVRLLRNSGRTLATAECGSAGRLAQWLSEAAGPESGYRGGMVVPDARALSDTRQGRELVELMASGCREQFGADYGLALGPLPPAELADKSPQKFFFALSLADGVSVGTGSTAGHPAILKDRAAKQSLDFLRRKLLVTSETRPGPAAPPSEGPA